MGEQKKSMNIVNEWKGLNWNLAYNIRPTASLCPCRIIRMDKRAIGSSHTSSIDRLAVIVKILEYRKVLGQCEKKKIQESDKVFTRQRISFL
jgi:hypothetical protein